jgi:hypothetical protein
VVGEKELHDALSGEQIRISDGCMNNEAMYIPGFMDKRGICENF